MVFLQMTHSCQSTKWKIAVHLTFSGLYILFCYVFLARVAFSNGKIMLIFLFNSSVYRANGTTLLKAEFLICLKGVNFSGVLFCGFLF